jgi:hypothetical protein
MIKACLVGAAVTFGLVAIPIVHFVTGLPSAFIGGYLAGSKAEATPGIAILIGCLMAAILVAPVGGVFFLMSLFWGFGTSTVAIFTGAFAAWIVLLGTLGALVGGNTVHKQVIGASASVQSSE